MRRKITNINFQGSFQSKRTDKLKEEKKTTTKNIDWRIRDRSKNAAAYDNALHISDGVDFAYTYLRS